MISHDRPVDVISSLASQKYPTATGSHEADFFALAHASRTTAFVRLHRRAVQDT